MGSLSSNSRLTFNNEGSPNEKSIYYSKKPHHPPGSSGVTIGRGYDMKWRTRESIIRDLTSVKIDPSVAALLSEAGMPSGKHPGYTGKEADEFVKRPDISAIRISEDQEVDLFNLAYASIKNTAKRVCEHGTQYGTCDWSKVDGPVKEFYNDLTYRGDNKKGLRDKIQTAINTNDYDTIIKVASDRSNFPGIDTNRFTKRIEHLVRARDSYKNQKGQSTSPTPSPTPGPAPIMILGRR